VPQNLISSYTKINSELSECKNIGGSQVVSDENLDEIKQIIDSMQSGLVELFDQLRELRNRLNMTGVSMSSDTQASVIPLFTEVEKESVVNPDEVKSESSSPLLEKEALLDEDPEHTISSSSTASSLKPDSEDIISEPITSSVHPEVDTDSKLDDNIPIGSAKVARVFDPIAHELRTGEAPASVLAEYLQSAKDYLFGGENSNERVERDMDVVLKFLKARNAKGIRTEERDNILKRINRWKEALVETH
jgi:hypothetical protein